MLGAATAAMGAATVGLSAGGNAYAEKIREGYTPDQALGYAVLVGASEGALQYLLGGISSLGGVSAEQIVARIAKINNGFAKFVLSLGTRALSEGMEEGLQEVLTSLFANALLGGRRERQRTARIQ